MGGTEEENLILRLPEGLTEIPYSVLKKVMTRIVNEVDHVNRVFYDITSKPPGTIEYE